MIVAALEVTTSLSYQQMLSPDMEHPRLTVYIGT